jgi:hypothetical protein
LHRHGCWKPAPAWLWAGALLLLGPSPARPAEARPLAPADARWVEAARRGAMRRLQVPECRKVLADFRGPDGRTLEQRLAVFAVPPEEYLRSLAFLDGRARARCRSGAFELLSTPGSARVLVCPAFLRTVWRDRTLAEVYVIHEMLHTLGLGEDPPTSAEITEQVERRCAP